MEKNARDGLDDFPIESTDYQTQSMDITSTMKSPTAETNKNSSHAENKNESSALGLLAMVYRDSSDSDEDDGLPNHPPVSEDNISGDGSLGVGYHNDDSVSTTSKQGYDSGIERGPSLGSSRSECEDEDSPSRSDLYGPSVPGRANSDRSECETHDCFAKFMEDDAMTSGQIYSPTADENDTTKVNNSVDPAAKPNFPFAHKCDAGSSRMHVFCLEHAVEVEKQLRPIGGVHILLLCHPGVYVLSHTLKCLFSF